MRCPSQHVRIACLLHRPRPCTALFFLAQVCKHRLASLLPTLCLSVFAGAITSLSIGVVGNCFIGLMFGFALQPACVPSYPVLVTPTRENASQWSETIREGIAFFFNPAVGLAVGVCTCGTPCCTHRSISREIVQATEELRSLREGVRLIRQPLRS